VNNAKTPGAALGRLIHRLNLEPDTAPAHTAEGTTAWIGTAGNRSVSAGTRIFGGLVVAQIVMAAGRTFPQRRIHSIQQVFLRPGVASIPIRYVAEPIFDGRTFGHVRVEAWQDDKVISHAQVGSSLATDGPFHSSHAPAMIDRSATENRDRLRGHADWDDQPIETLMDPATQDDSSSDLAAWMKPAGEVPNDPLIHQALMGYASDRMMLGVAWRPHRDMPGELNGATLNHNLWFHQDIDFSQWHHHQMDSPIASGGRGMIFGSFWTEDGQLAASTAQEGMLRLRR